MVHESGSDWQKLGDVWISDGEIDGQGTIEIRLTLESPNDATESTASVERGDILESFNGKPRAFTSDDPL